MSEQTQADQLLAAYKSRMDAAVASGRITREQADATMAAAQQRLSAAGQTQAAPTPTVVSTPTSAAAPSASGGGSSGDGGRGGERRRINITPPKLPQINLDLSNIRPWIIVAIILFVVLQPTKAIQGIQAVTNKIPDPTKIKIMEVNPEAKTINLNLPFVTFGIDWSIFGSSSRNLVEFTGEDQVTMRKPAFQVEFGGRYAWRFIILALFGIVLQFALDATQNLTGASLGGLVGPVFCYASSAILPPWRNLVAAYGFFLMVRPKTGEDEGRTKWITAFVLLAIVAMPRIIQLMISFLGITLYGWIKWLADARWLPYAMWLVAAWKAFSPLMDATSMGAFTIIGMGFPMMFWGKMLWIPEIRGNVFDTQKPAFRIVFLLIFFLGGLFFIKDLLTRGQKKDDNMTINVSALIRLWPMIQLMGLTVGLSLVVKFVASVGLELFRSASQTLDFRQLQEWFSVAFVFVWPSVLEVLVLPTYNAFKVQAAKYAAVAGTNPLIDAQASTERLLNEAHLGDIFTLGKIVLPNDIIAFLAFAMMLLAFLVPEFRWWIL